MKSVLIFGKDQNRANDKLKEILNNTPYGKVKSVKLAKDRCYFTTAEAEYKSIAAIEYNGGYKCNYAYVDKDISGEMFELVVEPAMTLNPSGIEFYD